MLKFLACLTAWLWLGLETVAFSNEVYPENDTYLEGPVQFSDVFSINYDKLRPPKLYGEPVEVEVSVSVLTIRDVNEENLSYDMDIFLHQWWTDHRLTVPDIYHEGKVVLDNAWKDDIWTPDLFFKNARDGKLHDIIRPYTYMILRNDSRVFSASRIGLKLNCMMHLEMYPHDFQECEIIIMSLQHTNESVKLTWRNFSLTENILLPQFDVVKSTYEECSLHYPIGDFSCLVGRVTLNRRLGYYMLNRFIPSILVVCMSFVTFWVPVTAYPARVTLSVTSLLTVVTLQYTISMPSVSYIMAINIWVMACITFVFGTLLEYTLVVAILNTQHGKTTTMFGDKVPGNEKSNFMICLWIDRTSRVFFPLCFVFFCGIYWSTYGRR